MQIYLIGNTELNYYKIGISSLPERRLRQLNVPFEIRVLAEYELEGKFAERVEKKLHEYYRRAGNHLKNEWFKDIEVEEFTLRVREFHGNPRSLPKLVSEWDTYSSGQRRELLLAKPSPALDKILKEATRKYEAAI